MTLEVGRLRELVRDIADFPDPGIVFRDLTPLWADPVAFAAAVDAVAAGASGPVDLVIGVEARGFILGAPVASMLGVGFVPVRKPGKLPSATRRVDYALEYGTDAVEIHADALPAGARVYVVDDVLATGGTARATLDLVERAGATVAGAGFLVELAFLGGRARLGTVDVHSVLTYEE